MKSMTMAGTLTTSRFAQKKEKPKKSILDISKDILQQDHIEQSMNEHQEAEPMLLIGDENEIADPLIKQIGRSLSAHFNYPKVEGNFGITGKVILQLIVHPEGYFSDVHIVRSSNNQNFDNAALYAVNTAPKVIGINKLLAHSKTMIVGYIFN